ncbi:hypothetical protein OG291_31510 [Streptomyces halstedii]|uniref:hypothetical protein n=1 Tax=Streptomyces halstedii TaxID=1944 RepID=UPI003868051E|nr:hypothetical protein OG291_00055 [Streptomyces halstedii]WSX39854.1 hypothetical protein OG291_31510 [Streptomyces halstedii]
MAVAQEVLVPVSRDAGDVLRELVEARVRLRETVSALRALTGPTSAVCTSAPGASGTPTPAAVPGTDLVLEEALRAVSRVDQATVQVMRERRSRS